MVYKMAHAASKMGKHWSRNACLNLPFFIRFTIRNLEWQAIERSHSHLDGLFLHNIHVKIAVALANGRLFGKRIVQLIVFLVKFENSAYLSIENANIGANFSLFSLFSLGYFALCIPGVAPPYPRSFWETRTRV
jgi:hypothetical protein